MDDMKYKSLIEKYLEPGVLGFFNSAEVYTVFAYKKDTKEAMNVFTIICLSEVSPPSISEMEFLTSSGPIVLRNLQGSQRKNYTFGLTRTTINLDHIVEDFCSLKKGSWNLLNKKLSHSVTKYLPPKFIPNNQRYPSAHLNKVLKNNFSGGSIVFEAADNSKSDLNFLINNDDALDELSSIIEEIIPCGIYSLLDRVGNFVMQLPSTILQGEVLLYEHEILHAKIEWHPKAEPRPLDCRVSCATEGEYWEQIYPIAAQKSSVSVLGRFFEAWRGFDVAILDRELNLPLLMYPSMGFIGGPNVNVSTSTHCLTTRELPDGSAVGVMGGYRRYKEKEQDTYRDWRDYRGYRDSSYQLKKSRNFIQYNPENPNEPDEQHRQALDDLIELIKRHGEAGVYLWDPFLDMLDISEVLFKTGYDCQQRALTSISLEKFEKRLLKPMIKPKHLNLVCRTTFSIPNKGFHDRFLIFPGTEFEKTKAWSLGTSINSYGKEHHILMKVPDAQRILKAFNLCWNKVVQDEQQLWP